MADIGSQKSDIDALVLVGGTCKIPTVRNFVSELLGRGPATGIDPMTAVAEGAAVASAILSGELEDRDFFVSTEHALGTIVIDPGAGLSFSELIPRNHKLPARVTKSYTPVTDFQEVLNVKVIEGDPAKPLDDDDNVILKDWDLKLPEPQPIGELSIELTYSYDVDGILNVSAQDSLGNSLLEDVVSYGAAVDRRNLTKIAQRASNALETGRLEAPESVRGTSLSPELRKLITGIQAKIIPFINDGEAASLRDAVRRVEAGDGSAAGELTAANRKYSYLL
jgi:molecular chaperone DnaK